MAEPKEKATIGETYQAIADKLHRTEPKGSPEAKKDARVARRLLWLCYKANWPPETTVALQKDVTAFFDKNKPATFNLTKSSYAVYRSEILSVLKPDPVRRRRYILTMSGIWRNIFDLTVLTDLPPAFRWRCSPLLWFLDERKIAPARVSEKTLMDFYKFSIDIEKLEEHRARRRAKEAAKYITLLSDLPEFNKFGFSPVEVKFRNKSIKYDVPQDIADTLLADFDRRVAPWARGELSNTGETIREYLQRRDEPTLAAQTSEKKRQWKSGAEYKGRTSQANGAESLDGFLSTSRRWKSATLKNARALVSVCVKVLFEAEHFKIETIEELTDPEIVAAYAAILHARQADKKHPSTYLTTIMDVIVSLAKRFLERSLEDIKQLSKVRSTYTVQRRGMSPRNREKLENFTPARVQKLIDMPDILIRSINREVGLRREAHRAAHGVLPARAEVYNAQLIREIMLVLAHHIMMTRAPRRANLSGIKLKWIRWRDDLATIEIPWQEVKKRKEVDGPLIMPLDPNASKLLKIYREKLRAKVLHPADPDNAYLFPSPSHAGRHRIGASYKGLPDLLARRVHAVVGARIHPHLWRHLIGWIWLREDPDKLPMVQKLLDHKNLQTTLDFYAEIEGSVALAKWQEFINVRKT